MNKQPSFLIVVLRFMGDVLVTTPLALSIKTALPDATIDYLVFKGTDKVLIKNPCIRNIYTISKGENSTGTLLARFQKYDVAIAAYPSDRTLIAAAIAGKRSLGLTYAKGMWWKRIILSNTTYCDDTKHVVANMLSLLAPLGIPAVPRAVMGYDDDDLKFARDTLGDKPYVLIHPYSLKAYKYWPAENWVKLAALIEELSDCSVVFTRTPEPEGTELLDQILAIAPTKIRVFDDHCTLNQLAALLKRAAAFVGVDTAITHMAAAMSIPTVAVFGPTLTRYWAPWPNGCTGISPFIANKGVQRVGNVTVVQKAWPCVACNGESCAISNRDKMECLEQLTPDEVFNELEKVLGERP